jgi:hypothetical protein
MASVTYGETGEKDFAPLVARKGDQKGRIRSALGITIGRLPTVDDEMLLRYYTYLSQNLSLPFTAVYSTPTNRPEAKRYECTVLEILDPSTCAYDEFDGIFCKTEQAGFEVNLPLIELEVPQDSPNYQMIEDYWYWFWNWR